MKNKKFYGQETSSKAKQAYVPVNAFLGKTKSFILGQNTGTILQTDPKIILFTLSKYKFASKLFCGFKSVLDLGCMEGLGSLLLAKTCVNVLGMDFYKTHIENAKRMLGNEKNISFVGADFLECKMNEEFDGVVCFDVLEHIDRFQEERFLTNCCRCLRKHGSLLIGFPSLESQIYASPYNREAHINCKTQAQGLKLLQKFFHVIYPFSMNDEIIHTGFAKMSHYFIYLCNSKKA